MYKTMKRGSFPVGSPVQSSTYTLLSPFIGWEVIWGKPGGSAERGA